MNIHNYEISFSDELYSPSLIYYLDALEHNIVEMIRIAGGSERLWPHVKSHKCEKLVQLQMNYGINKFKCATIAEAEMVASCGAQKIILAYPLVGPNIKRFLKLKSTFPGTECIAIGDSDVAINALNQEAISDGVKVDLLIDVNDGLNRTGIQLVEAETLYKFASSLNGITVRGFHIYDGHHHEKEFTERCEKTHRDIQGFLDLALSLKTQGYRCDIIVAGGSPTFPCHALDKELFLSPGTCILQDQGYASLLPDLHFEFAALLLTRVISHPREQYFTIDLGTKAVASDPQQPRIKLLGYEDAEIVMHNEEHLVFRIPEDSNLLCPPIGTVLYAIPRHICPTSALYPSAFIAKNGKIIDEWAITARNRKISI